MSKKKILFAGETWVVHTTEYKGFDYFTVSSYGEGVEWVRNAIVAAGYGFTHIPAHEVARSFPDTQEALSEYAAILVSDVGKNTFLLHPDTFFQSKPTRNKLSAIETYVANGGAYGMIGGYMTFMGMDGRAGYHGTVIEDILPVTMAACDDRVEEPEGFVPVVPRGENFWEGMPAEWPALLGYNRTVRKPGARVLLERGADPIIAVGEYGRGRTLAFATDCAPHWAPPAFCEWTEYPTMWKRLLAWMTQE
ncbi:MAG: glutamine amidotransferase [Planctomycetota bacterium]|nr:glutamine amidotransferase [Planctomycetota bacterium]